jgi:hypothetical protein
MEIMASSARSEPPPGIVMAITGNTDPPLSAMVEIPANTSIHLHGKTKLTFLHYARCKLITVEGGTLTLTRADYTEDGQVVSETDGPCPHIYALPDNGGAGRSSGGILERNLEMPPRWPVGSEIIFTGPRRDTVAAAAIIVDSKPDQAPIQLDLGDGRARLPQGATLLRPERNYTLRLTMRGRRDPVNMLFTATAPARSVPLVVLRID